MQEVVGSNPIFSTQKRGTYVVRKRLFPFKLPSKSAQLSNVAVAQSTSSLHFLNSQHQCFKLVFNSDLNTIFKQILS